MGQGYFGPTQGRRGKQSAFPKPLTQPDRDQVVGQGVQAVILNLCHQQPKAVASDIHTAGYAHDPYLAVTASLLPFVGVCRTITQYS